MSNATQPESLPAVFLSHGSPMVALQQGPYQDALAAFGRSLTPKAIVAISAHWGTGSTIGITSSERNSTIHDFGGFPPALYELNYPAPCSPEVANRVEQLLQVEGWQPALVADRGLDHGVWIPLLLMYPQAEIPVVEVSVPLYLSPRQLCRVGEALAPLRREGVLLLGSGGIVHNLRQVNFADQHAPVEPWAAAFDDWFRDALAARDLDALVDFADRAPHARLAVPTFEHFAPVFPILGAAAQGEVTTVYEGFEHGTISMRSFALR